MKNYECPVILDNEELAEGVYATGSGGTSGQCYNHVCDWDHKKGREYEINITGGHYATHETQGQVLVLTFNKLVSFSRTEDPDGINGICEGSSTNTNTLRIRYKKHHGKNTPVTFGPIYIDGNPNGVNCQILCDAANGI